MTAVENTAHENFLAHSDSAPAVGRGKSPAGTHVLLAAEIAVNTAIQYMNRRMLTFMSNPSASMFTIMEEPP